MEKYQEITTGKELIVRKKVASFIENFFRYLGYDFRHDIYKKIIYSEISFDTELEEKIKNFYDAYLYLLSNCKNPFSQSLLKRFFYIVYGKEIDKDLLLRLTTILFNLSNFPPLEQAVKFQLKAYKEMVEIDLNDRLIISFMFFNFVLVKYGIPTIVFFKNKLPEYEKIIKEEDEKTAMSCFLTELLNGKFQNKSFYENLKLIDYSKVVKILKGEETLLRKYGVKSLFIFGSYAKNSERVDSDIDLLMAISDDLSYDQKKKVVIYLQGYLFKKFQHFVDILEISDYLSDYMIKEMKDAIKIF